MMNRALDARRPRRRRRSSGGLAPAVSVLRWRSGPSTDGVFEMFSAREAGRSAALQLVSADSRDGRENVLLVSASRRVAPDTPAVLLSLVNTSPSQAVKLSLKLAGRTPASLTGTILTAPSMTPPKAAACTRPEAASPVPQPSAFYGAVLTGKVVQITVPAKSVVVLTVQ
jgi:alpha-L-arabinofuranosidase